MEHLADSLDGLVERLDHVSMAVRDIAATAPLLQLVGATFFDGADQPRGGFRWVQFDLPGGSRLELIQPLRQDSFLTRFLESRGEGMHHVTFKVTDLSAAIARAEELGLSVTGESRSDIWNEVFLRPATTHGVLVQLAEWEDGLVLATSLDEVLAGMVIDHS